MEELAQTKEFINFWFKHPASPDNIRFVCLPSEYGKKKIAAQGKKLPTIEFSAGRAQWDIGADQYVEKLNGFNERGYDLFYFVNWVDSRVTGNATNANVLRRLFLPIDLDYRLPISVHEFESELGLAFSGIVQTSKRKFPHHQLLLSVSEWGSDGVEWSLEEQRELAAKFCQMTGSDPIADAKRILRLPGMINWKGVEDAVGSRAKLVKCDAAHSYASDEVQAQFLSFDGSRTSLTLRQQRMTPVRSGGLAHSERGDYGRWDVALEKAERGEPSVGKGGRHNALLSWGWQMCAARLPKEVVRENWLKLAEKGVEGNYAEEEKRDYALLLRDVMRGWDMIDAELDEVMSGQEDAEGFADESDWGDAEPTRTEASGSSERTEGEEAEGETYAEGENSATDSSPAAPEDRGQGEPGEAGEPGEPREHGEHGSDQIDFGPIPTGPSSLIDFARQAANQCLGEREEHWIDWLASMLCGANHFDASDVGSISYFCDALQARLAFIGALRDGRLLGPVVSSDEKRAWSMSVLNVDEARIVVRHLFFAAGACLMKKSVREKVNSHTSVVAANKQKKKPRTVFSGKGELLVQTEREMMLRLAARVQSVSGRNEACGFVFQNGVHDGALWRQIYESIDPWEPESVALSRVWEAWKGNKAGKKGVLDPNVSWMRYERCCACSFGRPGPLVNGQMGRFWRLAPKAGEAGEEASHRGTARNIVCSQELATPMFDSFLGDTFGEDEEAKRGVLLVIAYCLLPDNPLQRYFFFEGVGGSGKGTLASLISCLVGSRNTGLVDIERMKSDAWLGPLEGKNLVIIDEAEGQDVRTMRHVMQQIARVTGSSVVSARVLNQNACEIRGGWKFILIANEQPESADKSGQQSRRVVPLYFSRKKQGVIVPELHRMIYRAEGDRIATKAVLEYLTRGMAAGAAIFDIDSPAFSEGKRRFEESTGGIRKVLKLTRAGHRNMPKLFLEQLVEIWIERKDSRKYLQRALDKTVTTEMAVLGFNEVRKARMPWPGPDGRGGDLLKGFLGCEIDTEGLLDELEMMPDELLAAIRERCVRRKKLWVAARHLLDLPEKDFQDAEGRAGGQQNFFN